MPSTDDIKFYSLIVVFIIIVGLGITSYVIKEDSPTNKNQQTEQQNSSTLTIQIKDFSFSPNNLKIKTGDTVTWVNNDSVSHSIKFETFTPFTSLPFGGGETFNYRFDQPGTYSYSCGIHPAMKGQIVVE